MPAESVKCNDKVATTKTAKRNIQDHHEKIAHTILFSQQVLQIKMLLSVCVIIMCHSVSSSLFVSLFVCLLWTKNSSFWHKFYRDRKWIYVSFSNQDHCPNWPSSHIWVPCRKSTNSKVWLIYLSLPKDTYIIVELVSLILKCTIPQACVALKAICRVEIKIMFVYMYLCMYVFFHSLIHMQSNLIYSTSFTVNLLCYIHLSSLSHNYCWESVLMDQDQTSCLIRIGKYKFCP